MSTTGLMREEKISRLISLVPLSAEAGEPSGGDRSPNMLHNFSPPALLSVTNSAPGKRKNQAYHNQNDYNRAKYGSSLRSH